MEYSKRLKDVRISANLKQNAFSEKLGIDEKYYSKLETGNRKASIPLHIKFCITLNKPSDFFLREERKTMVLMPSQLDYLKTLDKDRLKVILYSLKNIYETYA